MSLFFSRSALTARVMWEKEKKEKKKKVGACVHASFTVPLPRAALHSQAEAVLEKHSFVQSSLFVFGGWGGETKREMDVLMK